ncbi:MAG: DUF503 domain-containing protein [Armatimonadetes bacterium]|nr:DUF503 domain-containing protein [Armatimonadota bacterium]
MVVGVLVLELGLMGCHSLKDKRSILRSLVEKARHDFHVSIAEVGDHEIWSQAVVCASVPSTDAAHALEVLQSVERLFGEHHAVEITNAFRDMWRP